jgi:alpha-2-macroglobulin-like protein
MRAAPTKKTSLLMALFSLAVIVTPIVFTKSELKEIIENDLVKSIKKKMISFAEHLPEERIYVHTDKPFYEPGEDIWFATYVRNGEDFKATNQSGIVHVELINPKGGIEKKISLILKNGKSSGDFSLDKECAGGLYKLKAYTNWMKNEGEENAFIREIQVQDVVLPNLKMKLDFLKKSYGAGDEVVAKIELITNENIPLIHHPLNFIAQLNGKTIAQSSLVTNEDGLGMLKFNLPKTLTTNDGLMNVMIKYNGSTESISRAIPIVINAIDLQVFPEGGDLVNGIKSRLAFTAKNEFGKSADVEGEIVNSKGQKVTNFSSYHQGMGEFYLTPSLNETYFAKITKPEGVSKTFALPKAFNRGYVMNIENTKPEQMDVQISTTENEELAFIAQVRGKIYYSTVIQATTGINRFAFSTSNFPIGVAQLSLFDSKGIARAERMAFANAHKKMKINIQSEKEKFLPREKIKLNITVEDERGLPMPANLSMAVVNDQLLSFADDKSGNLLSQLLLQQDLSEKVEEPAFYFNHSEAKSKKALDLLLLTSGWRRFTWEKLLDNHLPPLKFEAEKNTISGIVYDAHTGKIINDAKIKCPNGEVFKSDKEGKFEITNLELYEPVNLIVESHNYHNQQQTIRNYQQNLSIYLYNKQSKYFHPEAKQLNDVVEIAAAGFQHDMELEVMDEVKTVKAVGKRPLKNIAPNAEFNKLNKKIVRLEKQEMNALVNEGLKQKALIHPNRGAFVAEDKMMIAELNGISYYRARQFPTKKYDKEQQPVTRTDFRNTIYWNPNIEVGFSGKKTIEFFASDDITSFRAIAEGIGNDGSLGQSEKTIFTQLPFSITLKIPTEFICEDVVALPVTLKNNTEKPIGGLLTVSMPSGLQQLNTNSTAQSIMPGEGKTIWINCKVMNAFQAEEVSVKFESCGLSDRISKTIKAVPKGFPVQKSFSSQELQQEFEFEINAMVANSLRASVTIFPNVVSDLLKGVDGILQEPYGCFEQTSCTAYPNAMVLDYLKTTESKNIKALARATELLDRGYKRLTTFETSNKGYEWFGANPAHEGLTAYGIMEFVDMQKAGQEIDKTMLERTALWLMNHKDGKGGFLREQRALHDFGRISDEVMNAYIVYALSEANYSNIKNEFESSYEKAMDSNDAYLLALAANSAFNLNETKKAEQVLNQLLKLQTVNGSFNGSSHSITYSQGQSLTIETTALTVLAILKSNKGNSNTLNSAINFIVQSRQGSGAFSSTQGTILALKALTEYAKQTKKTPEDGELWVYVDGKKVAQQAFKAGESNAITVSQLEKFIHGEGKHKVKLKYVGLKNALPYSLAINWNTSLPPSQKECKINLETQLANKQLKVGETVRMKIQLKNKTTEEVPSTIAIIGIPAGLSAQAWQLKELQEKHVFDYYEIKGNVVTLYYRGLEASALREINLDLKAEVLGEFESPASCAYLYYTNEFKTWCGSEKVIVKTN